MDFTIVLSLALSNERKRFYLDVRSEPLLHPPLALLGHIQLAEEAQLGHAGPDLSMTTQSSLLKEEEKWNLLVHCPTKVTNKSELVLLCVSLHKQLQVIECYKTPR